MSRACCFGLIFQHVLLLCLLDGEVLQCILTRSSECVECSSFSLVVLAARELPCPCLRGVELFSHRVPFAPLVLPVL